MVNKVFEKNIDRNIDVYVDDISVKSMINKCHLTDLEETFKIMNKMNTKK
jgi:hypothetical protein